MPNRFTILFENTSDSDTSFYAEELRSTLLSLSPDIEVTREREDSLTQDWGQMLNVVLPFAFSPAAVTAFVNVITTWLSKRPEASLTIKTPGREISAQGITSRNAKEILEIVLKDSKASEKEGRS
ncbi:MAG: hypothetical protein E6J34_22435 [Chloroflexi bacterium]|nr:MAG: hypothetical protein E6J34_22435 [Chloroflexota bacterium]